MDPVLCLLGPTAVGKTAVALGLCGRLGGEVVAADSRQIYRGLSIGSGAPTPAELAAAPHHLVGFLDPRETWSVAQFVAAAEAAIASIAARGRVPLVVAGTGLYLRALAEGWTLAGVPADAAVRARLEESATAELAARLAAVDPVTAARLAPTDRKRLVRALEVYEVSGEPLSARLAAAGRRPPAFRYRLVGLRRERAQLYARIEARVAAMLAAGWLDEVADLLAGGLTGDEPAFEGLGYRRLAGVLRGESDLAAATTLIQQDTRRFAKRQMTWFRAMSGVEWLDLDQVSAADAASRLAENSARR
jgi:tRNA dimethylallyltransferase